MKTRNMITSLVLIAALILSAFSVFAGASFSDVKTSDWFYSYVSKAAEKGIVSGYPDGTFRPQNKVTYAEFLVMAMRGTKSSNTRGLNDWYAPYYYGAVDNGIINEGEIAYTSMNNPIPRGDMAVVMAGVLAFNNLDSVKTVNAADTFSDISRTSRFEYPVALCNYYGALSGYPDGTFRPNGTLTRAEAATAMVALVETIEKYVVPTDPQQPPVTPDPEKAWPEPTDRASLLNYMNNFRTGVDLWYNNGKNSGPSTAVNMPYFAKDDAGKNATKFADADLLAYATQILNSAKFTKSGDVVNISYSWPNMPSSIKDASVRAYVQDASASRDGIVSNGATMTTAGNKSGACQSIKWGSVQKVIILINVKGTIGSLNESCSITYEYTKSTGKAVATCSFGGTMINNIEAMYSVRGTMNDIPSSVFGGLK